MQIWRLQEQTLLNYIYKAGTMDFCAALLKPSTASLKVLYLKTEPVFKLLPLTSKPVFPYHFCDARAKSQIRLSDFTLTFHFPALEKEMATHSSVLAWRIPGTGEPGGLPSMGSHRVGHD